VGGNDLLIKCDIASQKLRYIFEEPASRFFGMSVEEEITFSLETLDISREEIEKEQQHSLVFFFLWTATWRKLGKVSCFI
jgi:energy-coupling factor transporter ATP-binding protein EcfA2